MSQATFDQAAQGGVPDDSGETRSATAKTRRRPTHRGRGVKSAEAVPAAPATVAAPVATVSETPAPIAEEQPARVESRTNRGRGAAKRPAARGKTGAQLIINKAAGEPLPDIAPEPAPVAVTPEAAAEPAGEPVIIPVVTAEAVTPQTPAPLKTRFGQPRRQRQTTAATPVPSTEAEAQPKEAPAAEAEAPAAEAVAPAPTPRYRFDRSRPAGHAIAPARPERLSGGLYTSGAVQPAEAQETPAAEPSEPTFALPSLEVLTSATDELPTLAFGEPAIEEPASAEAPHEPMEGAEPADGASAASRRRRRRRRPNAHNGAHGVELDEAAEEEDESAEPEAESPAALTYAAEPEELPQPEPPRETRATHGESLRSRTGRFGLPSRVTRRTPVAPAAPAWEAPQPAAEASPYGSPEPASARGFGPTPAGVAIPAREVYPRPGRIERGDSAATSAAQLGAVIREAINTQTDRLLSELRRQQPPAVTLAIPNTQTAERVGIFVDVANVIYSARNLRTSVDFGHLLDFLRANRRLTRAQAYAPTDPMPGAEQAFLSAVRGLGYRITTKNYKTFSNGAKKADLDLDLCMDIVRMVDAKAVDTIVLVSGDSDFLPLLDYCSDHGVRVEVAAFDDAASMILRQSCDLFVNLSLVEGIRG